MHGEYSMSTTLTNGLKLPDKGSVDWYADMQSNYTILDGAVGTVAEHTTALAGKASLVHTHTKSDITDFPAYGTTAGTICEGNDSRLSDARTPVAHTHSKSDVTDLLNSNFIPSANNATDLGSSSYQWNNFYAKNYYYNGTPWGLDKNNWWSLVQFYAQNSIHVRNVEPGVAPSSDVSAGIKFENANASYVFADIVGKVFSSGTTFVNLIASNKFTNGALDPNGTTVSKNLQIGIRSNGTGFIYTDCGWRCNLVPPLAESGVYSLGTSTNQWNNLYAKNYYYNGVAWGLDKENTWSNINTYSREICINGDRNAYIAPMWEGAGSGIAFLSLDASKKFVFGQRTTDANNRYVYDATKGFLTIKAGETGGDTVVSVVPYGTDTKLGDSTSKWKTFNGVNPGALSLPSSDSADYIDLSSNLSTNAEYLYTAPYDGWLCLYVIVNEFYTENAVGLYRSDTSDNSHQWAKSVTAALNMYKQNKYQGSVMLPVESGKKYICYISLNANATINRKQLFFYKNKGNV